MLQRWEPPVVPSWKVPSCLAWWILYLSGPWEFHMTLTPSREVAPIGEAARGDICPENSQPNWPPATAVISCLALVGSDMRDFFHSPLKLMAAPPRTCISLTNLEPKVLTCTQDVGSHEFELLPAEFNYVRGTFLMSHSSEALHLEMCLH